MTPYEPEGATINLKEWTLVPTSQIIWNYNREDFNLLQWKPFGM